MASTIPCLRPFLASFFTGFGAMGGETVIAGSQVGNSGSNNSREKSAYALGSMQSADRVERAKEKRRSSRSMGLTMMRGGRSSRDLDNFGNDAQNQAHVGHDTTGSSSRTAVPTVASGDAVSIVSNESTKMIITKEVQWHVDSERGSMVRPW